MSITYLANLNKHERDNNISFKDRGHVYTIKHEGCPQGDTAFTSVTTLVHSLCSKFDADNIIKNMMSSNKWSSNKYYGLTKTEIKKMWQDNGKLSAEAGTKLHSDIEHRYNGMLVDNSSIEYLYFLKFFEDYKYLIPYRTEWLIYHEQVRLAGSIDMVFSKSDGTFDIYDWKRVKEVSANNKWNKWLTNDIVSHLPDTNYWHYALQLNIYKAILIEKYNLNVDQLYLVVLHPNNSSYIRIPMPNLQEEVSNLFRERYKIILT